MQCKDRGKNTRNDKNNRPEKANRMKSQKLVRLLQRANIHQSTRESEGLKNYHINNDPKLPKMCSQERTESQVDKIQSNPHQTYN